jgi:hypothetical protein
LTDAVSFTSSLGTSAGGTQEKELIMVKKQTAAKPAACEASFNSHVWRAVNAFRTTEAAREILGCIAVYHHPRLGWSIGATDSYALGIGRTLELRTGYETAEALSGSTIVAVIPPKLCDMVAKQLGNAAKPKHPIVEVCWSSADVCVTVDGIDMEATYAGSPGDRYGHVHPDSYPNLATIAGGGKADQVLNQPLTFGGAMMERMGKVTRLFGSGSNPLRFFGTADGSNLKPAWFLVGERDIGTVAMLQMPVRVTDELTWGAPKVAEVPAVATEHVSPAWLRAGYECEDTPCEPKRSSYQANELGDKAFERAMGMWQAYLDIIHVEDVDEYNRITGQMGKSA